MTLRDHISPFRRGLSALLVLLYLAAALGAVRHAGEHDESGLEWLPAQYHHHHYEIAQDDAEAPFALQDLCVACHWSRLGQRHAGGQPVGADAAPVLRIVADGSVPDVRDGSSFLPDSRGPPSA